KGSDKCGRSALCGPALSGSWTARRPLPAPDDTEAASAQRRPVARREARRPHRSPEWHWWQITTATNDFYLPKYNPPSTAHTTTKSEKPFVRFSLLAPQFSCQNPRKNAGKRENLIIRYCCQGDGRAVETAATSRRRQEH